MMNRKSFGFLLILSLLVSAVPAAASDSGAPQAQTPGQHVGQLVNRGSTSFGANAISEANLSLPEGPDNTFRQDVVNRIYSRRPDPSGEASGIRAPTVSSPSSIQGGGRPLFSFHGLSHFDQRNANSGNQFSLEPPDQGLCVGNGFVLETVNDVMRVFDTSGSPVSGVVDLNTFYGYPAQFDRTTGLQGPFITDPSCYYDPDNERWFHVVLTLDVDPVTGEFLGPNHLDLAVSQANDPTGDWNLYSIPAQNDGSDGTPDHQCDGGPCIGDYPHIGADLYGFYISTNEYAFFADQYTTAQIYAMSKSALAAGEPSPAFVHFDDLYIAGRPGFTVWPATSPVGEYAAFRHGTEFFLSSMATEESGNTRGFDFRLGVWAITNTSSLVDATPSLNLLRGVLPSEIYGVPPASAQKEGDVPLADCLNVDCLGFGDPPEPQEEGVLDSLDSRMQQVWYADGKIWGAQGTIVRVGGQFLAGIAYFVVDPTAIGSGGGVMLAQGYLAIPNNNVIMPAIATFPDGRGVIAFTLVGEDFYPSAAFAIINQALGVGPLRMAAEGLGPQDGFTEYFLGGGRPRWGDYGAAVVDGGSLWFASEYIGQTCTFEEFFLDTSCGGTRSALANWGTRISRLSP